MATTDSYGNSCTTPVYIGYYTSNTVSTTNPGGELFSYLSA